MKTALPVGRTSKFAFAQLLDRANTPSASGFLDVLVEALVGSPWEKGYCESFNAKLRDELLNREIFYSLVEAQIVSRLGVATTIRSGRTRRSAIDHSLHSPRYGEIRHPTRFAGHPPPTGRGLTFQPDHSLGWVRRRATILTSTASDSHNGVSKQSTTRE
jgi:hypothetical protein